MLHLLQLENYTGKNLSNNNYHIEGRKFYTSTTNTHLYSRHLSLSYFRMVVNNVVKDFIPSF